MVAGLVLQCLINHKNASRKGQQERLMSQIGKTEDYELKRNAEHLNDFEIKLSGC